MSTLTTESMREERATHIAAARAIVDGAKAANRDLTSAQTADVESHLDGVKNIDKQIKGRNLVNSVTSLDSVDGSDTSPYGSGAKSLFSEADRTGIVHAIKSRTAYRADLDAKAITTGTMLPTIGSTVAEGLHPLQFPIASLFPSQPAEGPSVRYYRTTAGVAEVVAEGALKPDAGVAFTAVDILLTKLACRAEFSDEMADDSPQLLNFLQQELMAAIVAAESAHVVSTFNTTSGVLTATGATATVVDLIADAIGAQESISGTTPTAILCSPSTVAAIRKSKASTSGVYVTDVLSTSPTTLHGVRLVSSPAVSATNVWVVCSTGTTIFRRGGATVEIGTSGDNFARNLRTAVAEERLAVAVTRHTSLSKIVLT